MVIVKMRKDSLGWGGDEKEVKGREAGRDGSSTGSQQPSFRGRVWVVP